MRHKGPSGTKGNTEKDVSRYWKKTGKRGKPKAADCP